MEEQLFSYGTLQQEEVQLKTFGRLPAGSPDSLQCYKTEYIKITDAAVLAASGKTHHPIVVYTGIPADTVSGTVFSISATELKKADDYEVDDYERISVLLNSGTRAWVYIKR